MRRLALIPRCAVIGPLMSAVLALAGCATSTQTVLEPLPPIDEGTPPTARLDGAVAGGRVRRTAPEVSAAAPSRIGTAALPAGEEGSFSLDFADADIRAVIDQILGTMLKVDYTVDPEVKGTATFRTASPLPRALLLPTLETLLNQNGAALVQAGPLYRVLPAKSAAAAGGAMMLPLRYASAPDLVKVLQPIIGQNAPDGLRLSADAGHNALVVSGDASMRAAIASLVRAFDTDLMAGQSYALFPVTSDADPRKVASELDKIFQTGAGGALAGVVRVVPMEEAQAVLVIASAPSLIEDARRLFALIDRTRAANARDWHIYFAQNGDSTELAVILQRAFTPGDVSAASLLSSSATKSGVTNQPQFNSSSTAGTSSPASGTTTSGATTGTTGTIASAAAPAAGGGSSGASPAAESLSSGGGDSGIPQTTPETLRIIADRTNNAILIYATPDEEDSVDAMLRRIDILPLQVRIDATVAEVELNDQLQYGTQFFLKKGGINGLLTTGTSAVPSGGLTGLAPGFTATMGSIGSAEGVLSALSDVTNVRVLSSPEIMVLDNQPAHLLVGNLIPYLTQSSQSTVAASAPIVNSVSYRETGIILDVTPRIGKGGLVTLDLSQEVSDLGAAEVVGGQSTPTFSERQVHSRVVIQDGATVGLAGLISDNVSRENAGIPLLKDIPYLGTLFSTQTNTRKRTELMVLITPHVERNQREIRALTEDLRRRLPAPASVPQEVGLVPPSGKANPNASVIP